MKRGIPPQPMTPVQLEKIVFCALAGLSKGPERFADFLFALVGKSLSSVIPAKAGIQGRSLSFHLLGCRRSAGKRDACRPFSCRSFSQSFYKHRSTLRVVKLST